MTKGRDSSDVPSGRRLLLFYLPLVVLALSQQLTYPLVGSIVSHGPLGEQEFTAYAVGQQVLFLIGAVGAGLITTGMMFCRSNVGLRNFLRMNLVIAGVSAALQLCTCLPGIDRLVFGRALGLDGEMLRIARDSLLWCIPLQTIFFLRNPYLAALFNAKRSGLTNYATLLRVVMALSFASVFPLLGWTGWGWGVFATTLPALLETLLTWWLARPFLRGLPELPPDGEPVSCARQLSYTIPLSASGLLIHASTIVIAAFLALTPDPALFRPVHFLVIGIVNPLSISALRMQTLTVAFRPERHEVLRRIVGFGAAVGLALGCIPLIVSALSAVSRWYFCTVQNLPGTSLGMARSAMAFAALFPLIYATRGFAEGFAAVCYRTGAVMVGQIVYFLTLIAVLSLFRFVLPVPGYLWGLAAMASAAVAAAASILGLVFFRIRH